MGFIINTLGSRERTLEQKDLVKFKERILNHIKNNGLAITE